MFPKLKEESDVTKVTTEISVQESTFNELLYNLRQYKDIDEITVGNSMVRDCYYSFDLTLDNQIERVVLKGKEKEDSKVLWVTNKDV